MVSSFDRFVALVFVSMATTTVLFVGLIIYDMITGEVL